MAFSLKLFYFLLLAVLPLLHACSSTAKEDSEIAGSNQKNAVEKRNVSVEIADVFEGPFYQEIISNGKALAINSAEIRFSSNGEIKAVLVKNGDYVSRGQVLVKLDDEDLKIRLAKSRDGVDKATVELDDRLIDYGFRLKDSSIVPKSVMRMARIKSGYNGALYESDEAKKSLDKTKITAPFSGKIANLKAKNFNAANTSSEFCTLLDDHQMRIEFNVLETEYKFVSKGTVIEVAPFGRKEFVKGVITEVEPFIDNNGMIKITGVVDNVNGYFLNGMSVRVVARNTVSRQLSIPKEAVLERQGREVVFTYENGRAKWNYVGIGLQNSRFVSINSGLKKGQKVIVTNNVTLTHDLEVSLKQ
nr:efflux RND transporter periplasmic adaptor subunit [uncultured Pedobacter sp.]